MRKNILMILMAFVVCTANAQDARMTSANEQYATGNFSGSIEIYENILKSGVESEALYFNLGNAYYKTGQLPHAILNYERALLLDPDDKDIIYNLELANSQIADRINAVGQFFLISWFNGLISKGTSDFWAWIGIAAFVFTLTGLAFFLYSSNGGLKKVGFFSAIAFLALTLLALTFSYRQKDALVNRTEAIVFAPTVTVKSSPDNSGTDLFVIHEGTKVKILDKLGTWRKIQIKDGSEGWIEVLTIEVI